MADAVQARIEREARFACDVSHELRSPITALAAAAEVIDGRRGELPDRTQQALDVVVGQVRRFDAMVIDLLELSRIDAGATDLNTEQVEIETLCRRVAARNGFADLPIDVTKPAGMNGAPLTAMVDRLRFERILANLLENAVHHGGGPVRISIEPTDGPFLLVAVEDAGPGVARGERARIFERFARGSAARHRIGTGLGLALVAEHATRPGRRGVGRGPTGRRRPLRRAHPDRGRPVRRLLGAARRASAARRRAGVVRRRRRRPAADDRPGGPARPRRDDDHARRPRRRCRAASPTDLESSAGTSTTTIAIAAESVALYFVDGSRLQPVTIDLAGTPRRAGSSRP